MALNLNLAIKLIPEFDGSSKKLHKFISSCDIVHKKLNDEFNEESLIEIILLKLQDNAYDVMQYKQFKNYQELRLELNTQFSETRPIEYLQVELVRAKQLPNEDVKSFAHKIENLLNDLNRACIAREGDDSSTIIQNLNATTALKSFEDGLKEPLQIIIKACRFKKLKEAISKALEEEATLNYKMTPTNLPRTGIPMVNYRPNCQICKKIGHTAETCFRRNSNEYGTSKSSSRVYENSNKNFAPKFSSSTTSPYQTSTPVQNVSIICDYCKRIGHHIKNCRKRKSIENHRSINNNQSSINTIENSENTKPLAQSKPNTAVRVETL